MVEASLNNLARSPSTEERESVHHYGRGVEGYTLFNFYSAIAFFEPLPVRKNVNELSQYSIYLNTCDDKIPHCPNQSDTKIVKNYIYAILTKMTCRCF